MPGTGAGRQPDRRSPRAAPCAGRGHPRRAGPGRPVDRRPSRQPPPPRPRPARSRAGRARPRRSARRASPARRASRRTPGCRGGRSRPGTARARGRPPTARSGTDSEAARRSSSTRSISAWSRTISTRVRSTASRPSPIALRITDRVRRNAPRAPASSESGHSRAASSSRAYGRPSVASTTMMAIAFRVSTCSGAPSTRISGGPKRRIRSLRGSSRFGTAVTIRPAPPRRVRRMRGLDPIGRRARHGPS